MPRILHYVKDTLALIKPNIFSQLIDFQLFFIDY